MKQKYLKMSLMTMKMIMTDSPMQLKLKCQIDVSVIKRPDTYNIKKMRY